MGNGCGRPFGSQPNYCNVLLYENAPTVDGFCSIAGFGGDPFRSSFCDSVSDAGEWGGYTDVYNGCSYNDCNYEQDIGFGCCGICCGIVGSGVSCQRTKFTGDPVTCCFNDYVCTAGGETAPACYSDSMMQNTCSYPGTGNNGGNNVPNYRDITSTDCQNALLQFCTGTLTTDPPDSTAWLDRWFSNNPDRNCPYAIARNIYNTEAFKCRAP